MCHLTLCISKERTCISCSKERIRNESGVDFRQVNEVTVPDRYLLRTLKDAEYSLGGESVAFTALDLWNGFYQIPVDDKSRELNGFTTNAECYV